MDHWDFDFYQVQVLNILQQKKWILIFLILNFQCRTQKSYLPNLILVKVCILNTLEHHHYLGTNIHYSLTTKCPPVQ
jgi:hypothetical protein